MLNYEEFQSYVEESILDFLPEKYENAIVSINTVTKNNGRELQAVCVRTQESNISPTVYLESFYEQYKNGAENGFTPFQAVSSTSLRSIFLIHQFQRLL